MLISIIKEVVKIPEDVSVEILDEDVKITGPKGNISKKLYYSGIKLYKENDSVIIEMEYPKKTQRALIGTFASHIKNMSKGVTEGFEYKLKIIYAHFPMTVKVVGDAVEISNFVGEKVPRKATIESNDTNVSIKGSEIIVSGISIEDVGQTAANIEQATKIKRRDRRVFQDGIYLIEKNGVPIR